MKYPLKSEKSKNKKIDESMSTTKKDINPLINRIMFFCFLLAVTLIVIGLWNWSSLKGLGHDELEHTHAAWLLYKGQRPYTDFWEHHSPHYWYFLKQYYVSNGENINIFKWGRKWMLITFVLSIVCTYLIGKELFGPLMGIAGAIIFAANRFGFHPAVSIRPDGWMLCFLLAGVYVFIRAWNRSFEWYNGIIAGSLLGMAFAIHPRSGFTVLALALLVTLDIFFRLKWSGLWKRKIGLLLFTLSSFFFIALPFFVYGFKIYYKNVYVWSALAQPSFPPWPNFAEYFIDGYAILPFFLISIPICVMVIIKNRQKWFKEAALLLFVVCNIFGICIATRPFVQSFYVLMPFAGLFSARSIVWVLQRLKPVQVCIGICLLVAGGAIPICHPSYWEEPDILNKQLAQLEEINKMIPKNERYSGKMYYHPIFRFDGTYYWFDIGMKTFKAVDPSFRHDFVEEIKRTRTFLVQKDFLNKVAYDPPQVEAMKQYLVRNYKKMRGTPFYIRKE